MNTILKAWSEHGLIQMQKDGIRILQMPRLRIEAKRTGFDLESYLAGWHGDWQGNRSLRNKPSWHSR